MLVRQLPVKRLALADGSERMVVSVYDLVLANYGLDRGLDDGHSANNYNDVKAYTGLGRTDYRRAASTYRNYCA